MFLETGLFQERFTTFATRMTTFNVNLHVSVQVKFEDKSFFALCASMRAAPFVDHQVLGKMSFLKNNRLSDPLCAIRKSYLEESLAASRADVRSFSRMPHVMFLEQLASTELLPANITLMGLLPTVDTQMCTQLSFDTKNSLTMFAFVLWLITMGVGIMDI